MAATTIEYAKNGEVGVSKTMRAEGNGNKPKMGELLRADYSVFIQDGTVLKEGKNKEFHLGRREVWGTGCDLGLASMRVGERATITCNHEFAGPSDGHPTTTIDLRLISIVGDGAGLTTAEVKFCSFIAVIMVVGVLTILWKDGFFHAGTAGFVH